MSQYLVYEETYKGFRIQIEYDQGGWNPRDDCNLGKIVAFHPRYDFVNESNMTREEAVEFYENSSRDEWIMLPIFMYEHGSIGFNTDRNSYPYNCPWDSSHIGFIYLEVETAKEEYGNKYDRDKVVEYLHNEVITYGQWCNGEVYYYSVDKAIDCENCHNREYKPIEGCGGYIGDWDYALADAKSAIDQEA